MAEVALVMMLVSFGSDKPAALAKPTTSATVKPNAKPICVAGGVATTEHDTNAVVLRNSADQAAASRLIGRITQLANGKRPGMVLLFGVAYPGAGEASGKVVSSDMVSLLKKTAWYRTHRPAMRPFMQLPNAEYSRGDVYVSVYFKSDSTC